MRNPSAAPEGAAHPSRSSGLSRRSFLAAAAALGLLPAGGWPDFSPAHMLLPVITLALPQVAVIARLIRGSMLEALRSDHVRTARAYGLPLSMVVGVHALRAASLPVLSYLGPAAAAQELPLAAFQQPGRDQVVEAGDDHAEAEAAGIALHRIGSQRRLLARGRSATRGTTRP